MFAETIRADLALLLATRKRPPLEEASALVHNLRVLYHVMRASESLLVLAVERSQGELQAYYRAHLEEERGHDEWLWEDLQSEGIEPFPCPRGSAELAGSQYYHLIHTSPVCLLGYLILMEGFSMPLARVDTLEALYGKKLLRTVRFHAEHDTDHFADLAGIVETLPESDRQIVRWSAMNAAAGFLAALEM